MPRDRKSTPGPRCRAAAFLDPAKALDSAASWYRRRRMRATSWCVSSIRRTPRPQRNKRIGFGNDLSQGTNRVAKILIAEDNDDIRGLVVRALSDDGHDLVATENGVAALEALNQHSGDFDLLLTDVKMPLMDGIALALAAGRDHPDIAIMLMTGYADQRERTHGLDALVHDVIAKPFTLEQIKGAVREALVARH